MNLIILNCNWCGGEYNISLTWDNNKAHKDIKHYDLGVTSNESHDVDMNTFKLFLEKLNEVDLLCLNKEYLPSDGMYLEDGILFDFLYVKDNYFCTTKWQLGTEDEDIMIIEDAIALIDPKFNDLF